MINSAIIAVGRRVKQSQAFSRYANLLAYHPGQVYLTVRPEFTVCTDDDSKFALNDQIDSLIPVKGNPWFEGVRPTDVVLDIGANIGAICIPLARTAKKVYAVEPIFFKELKQNVELNGLRNVAILQVGIGDTEDKVKYEFAGHVAYNERLPFSALKKFTGPVDFLKCDCEGAEWQIHPSEMAGIRELRFEFHIRRGREKEDYALLANWYDWLIANNYKYDSSEGGDPGPIMPISRCMIVRASKR